jgi:hypothetical protein
MATYGIANKGFSSAATSATIDTNVARNPLLAIPPTLLRLEVV